MSKHEGEVGRMGRGITTGQTNKQEFRKSQRHTRDNGKEEMWCRTKTGMK